MQKNYAKSHLYKQAGNSVVVPVITRIAENIMKSIEKCNNREVQRETAIC
ncbi:MAG: DNA cytosine methyltransferase [Finegoldia magna]